MYLASIITLSVILLYLIAPGAQKSTRATSSAKVSSANTQQANDSRLLEIGNETRTNKTAHVRPTEIKILSYNIRWRSGDDLKKLIKFFRDDPEIGSASIMGLQEVDRRKKRSGNTNTARLIAEELRMNYAWAAPPSAKDEQEEETGVAIMSVYPLSDIRRIVLPHEGPNRRRRVALGATINVEGREWRVYSAHADNRVSVEKKIDQMDAVLKDLAKYPPQMPAIVVGDLNTWELDADDRTIKLFSAAGLKTPFGGDSTFMRKVLVVPIKFRLDWVWLRGIESTSFGIDKTIDVSDHWPLWTNLKLPSTTAK